MYTWTMVEIDMVHTDADMPHGDRQERYSRILAVVPDTMASHATGHSIRKPRHVEQSISRLCNLLSSCVALFTIHVRLYQVWRSQQGMA